MELICDMCMVNKEILHKAKTKNGLRINVCEKCLLILIERDCIKEVNYEK